MRSDQEVQTRNEVNIEESMMSPLEGRCEVGPVDHDFDLADRTTWTVKEGRRIRTTRELALVASSETHGGDHRPVLDIDVPMRYVPSTTQGHGHLYIDLDLTWDQYAELLKVLARCGIIEDGYLYASLEREATFVRLPWVRKVDPK